MVVAPQMKNHTHSSSGARLVTPDGRELPLKETCLHVRAEGGLSRAILEQRFTNPYQEPLHVSYLLPLPADGAVSGFRFEIAERVVVGEIEKKQLARERFEAAIAEGRTAALLEQDRTSLFTQEVGNIPPGAELRAEISVDQRLVWLDEPGAAV